MIQEISVIVYPVNDLAKAKAYYRQLLGVDPYADSAWYVGFRLGGVEVGLDPNGHKSGQQGPLPYLKVADIRASIQALAAAGATVQQEPRDVGGGMLVATVKDADGNVTGLRQFP